MDLVKSHLMYAVREEVEVLKEQIKELLERNSVLERENVVLKSISNTDQLSQLSTPVYTFVYCGHAIIERKTQRRGERGKFATVLELGTCLLFGATL
uniref:Uncharacterized protein n=1 Tax=Gadus morhua TaxID=8049 RepID=A0A8C4ZSC8_GADMO